MVEAKWSGVYPNKCYGEWSLSINGIDYSYMIPEKLRHLPMDTYGFYRKWNWDESFCDYVDGLSYEKWVAKNPWILNLPAKPHDLYCAFQSEDWRHGECGGCI